MKTSAALVGSSAAELSCAAADNTGDPLFELGDLVRYVSTMIRLIATGTPGRVDHARTPPRLVSG